MAGARCPGKRRLYTALMVFSIFPIVTEYFNLPGCHKKSQTISLAARYRNKVRGYRKTRKTPTIQKKTRLNIEHISETYPKFLKFPLHEKNRSINHGWGSIRIFLDAYFVRPRLGLRMDRTKNWHNIPQVHPSLTRQKDRSAWEHAMLWTFKAGQHVYPVAEQPMLQHIKTNPPFQKIKSHNQCFQNINFKWPRTTGILN